MATNSEPLPADPSTFSETTETLDTDDVVDRYQHRGPAGQDSPGSPRPDSNERGGQQPGKADKQEPRQR
jgi:hypothetical protein